ncbi:MAG: 16S rRNA (guanine(527)-N(7))-methyltransferase RsmG [Bacteroidales bacterium]|nr:16S rRNA (guanine(527)-N(7))-methyltransferase RsmG [Bacteroidales bacterium]
MDLDASCVFRYFSGLSDIQKNRILELGELYPTWNEKINVISRKDIQNLYPNHVLHSLAIAKFLTGLPEGTSILDMGTGGGFPGIPLAIVMPQCRFHLIDRIGKKIKVASEIASSLGLDNVTFQHGDIGECREKYDFVVSRAVMTLDSLIPLVRKNIRHVKTDKPYALPNGLVCLKGGDLKDEIRASLRLASEPLVDDLANYFPEEPFFKTKKLVYLPL